MARVIYNSSFNGVANQRMGTFGTTQTGIITLRSRNGVYTSDGNLKVNGSGEAGNNNTVLGGYWMHGTYPLPRTNEYDIEFTVSNLNGNDDPVMALGRLVDDDNYYAGSIRNGGANPDQRLIKCVSGVITSLGTANIGETTPVDVKLEIRDATKKLYSGGTERISSADNSITDIGEAGMGWGNLVGLGGDDGDVAVRISELTVTDQGVDVSLDIGGGIEESNLTAVAASGTTLSGVHHEVIGDTTSGSFPTSLPAASDGKFRYLCKNKGSANTWTLARNGSDTIDGAAADKTLAANKGAMLLSDGVSNWEVLDFA